MTSANEDESGKGWFSLSLARGLAVIRAFGPDTPQLSVSEVAAQTGISRAAARRILLTLHELGYAAMHGDRWLLRPSVLDLGYAWAGAQRLDRLVQPVIEDVASRTGQSASLANLHGMEIFFVARAAAPRRIAVRVAVGSRLPAHATALGKILLSALPIEEATARIGRAPLPRFTPATVCDPASLLREIAKARQDGYATVHGELDPEVASLAVAVGKVALNVSTHAATVARDELAPRFLPILREAAASLKRIVEVSPESWN